MSGADLTPILRIDPHPGLMIDVETWAQAHSYHQRHQRLHALHWHGAGIARGLGVVANAPPDDTVAVEPGLAIDGSGHVILVPDYERVALPSEGAVAYVKLEYVERPDADAAGRVVEDFRIRATATAPDAGELELARIERDPDGEARALPASSWWSPARQEIDPRFRRVAVSGAARALTLGYLGVGEKDEPGDRHLEGFFYLVRAMRRAGIDVRPLVVAEAAALPAADLYYVTGAPGAVASPAVAELVHDAVVAGARLLVDGCSANDPFVDAIRDALPESGSAPEDLERDVLRAHHVLAAPPPGAEPDGDFAWDVAGPLTGRDYGCAWAGRAADSAAVRDALEFGVNVAAWASSPVELAPLDSPPA